MSQLRPASTVPADESEKTVQARKYETEARHNPTTSNIELRARRAGFMGEAALTLFAMFMWVIVGSGLTVLLGQSQRCKDKVGEESPGGLRQPIPYPQGQETGAAA